MKNVRLNEDTTTRNILNRIRTMQESCAGGPRFLTEENGRGNQGAIAITNDPKFGQQVLKQQEDAFRSNVDSGVKFADENPDSPGENPLIFIPSERNMVFSGTIPSLNNLKWQYVLNDSENIGIYLFMNGQGGEGQFLRLTDNNLKTLQKIRAYYDIWAKSWNESSSMFDNLVKND